MNKSILSFLLISIISVVAVAQDVNDNETRLQKGEDINVLYHNEWNFGIFIHNEGGFGLDFRRGYQVNAHHKRMYEIEAQNFKDPKEIKSVSPLNGDNHGYVYGKLNSFFIVRGGIGNENIIYEKSDKKSVEVRYLYFIGAVINFAKPTYLQIENVFSDQSIYTTRYDPAVDNQTNIYGKADYFTGIQNTTIYPGGYARLAVNFDFAKRYNGVKSIEVGTLIDVYPENIPMMAYVQEHQVFWELYLKFVFGKKWF